MHLADLAAGYAGGSAIVGGNIPIAAGMALAFAMRGEDRVAAVFFGDGAAEEGVFYESVNFAVLKRLPVLFILENNGWSVCSPLSSRRAGELAFHRGLDPALLFSAKVDGNDAAAVYAKAGKAVRRARQGLGPSLLECLTYRVGGHAGPEAWDPPGYRDLREKARWRHRCPVARMRRRLLRAGLADSEAFSRMEEEVAAEIEAAFALARKSPFPGPADIAAFLHSEQ